MEVNEESEAVRRNQKRRKDRKRREKDKSRKKTNKQKKKQPASKTCHVKKFYCCQVNVIIPVTIIDLLSNINIKSGKIYTSLTFLTFNVKYV